MAVLATAAIAMLVVSLSMYSHRLARSDAREAWRDLKTQLDDARTKMNNPFVDQQELTVSIRWAKLLLDKYGVFTAVDLDSVEPFKHIDSASRAEMRQDTAELLYQLASGTGQLAVSRPKAERKRLFDEALRFNKLSQQVIEPSPPPRAVLAQKERLQQRAKRRIRIQEIELSDAELSAMDHRDIRMLANEIFQREDFETAVQLFERVNRAYPQDPGVWISLGSCYLSMQEFADAKGYFNAAIALKNDCAIAYELRGLAFFGLGEFEKARDDFDVVLRDRPNLNSALINRSLVLKELGDIDGAVRDLTTALKSEQCPTRAYFMRADLRRHSGDVNGGEEDRLTGLQSIPNDESSWVARGIARLPEDHEGALADFREALDLNPRSHDALQNMAHVYSERLNRPEQAIQYLDELLAISPDDARTRVTRGVLYARLERRDEATADAMETLKLSDQPFVIYQGACIYALTSRKHPADADTAVQLFGRALKRDIDLSQYAVKDPDLDAIRSRAEFQTILKSSLTLQQTK
jgi:tetratricopeptide (TPR) repeat protein